MNKPKRYEDEITDYRRGFMEGQAGERDVYMLYTGCTDVDEYCRGYLDGLIGQPCED